VKPASNATRTILGIIVWTIAAAWSVESYGGDTAARGAEALGRRVIVSDDIRNCGASRVGDLLLMLDAWAPTTIDGFTWQCAPRGLDSYQTATWTVMVDGVRIDVRQFGVTALNRIPVHVGDIDSVEVIQLPQLAHGEFVAAGLIHIHTRRCDPGPQVRAAASTGNEAGDPGPWAYTTNATPNVDRIGPTYSVYGAFGVPDAAAAGAYLRDRHYPTDAAVRVRTFGIGAGDYPQMALNGGFGQLTGRLYGGWHRAYLASSRFEDYFFFKPYGREIPVVSCLTAGGLAGRFSLGGRADLEYRLGSTEMEIGYRPNTLQLDFDWRERIWLGGVEVSLRTSSLRHRYGIGYERVEAETGYALSDRDYHLIKYQADWEWSALERLWNRVSAMATQGQGEVSLDAVAAGGWRIDDSNRLEAAVSYTQRRPERDGRIWYWQERGYDFLRDAGVGVSSDAPLGTARRWTTDIAWAIARGRRLSGRVSTYGRDFSNLWLEQQRFQFDPDEQAFSGPVELLPAREGRVAGGEVVVDTRPWSVLRLRTAYRYERAVSGDEVFREVWDAVPRHLLRQAAFYVPVPNLTLWACLSWGSTSTWHDYEDAAAQSGGAYSASLDDVVTFDAAFTKWFWRRRLKGHILVSDLFGWGPRYHPIGASFDTTVFAGIELLLGPSSPPSSGGPR
jgi:hypothetical protein